jgi:hypothetical protein
MGIAATGRLRGHYPTLGGCENRLLGSPDRFLQEVVTLESVACAEYRTFRDQVRTSWGRYQMR